MLRVVVVRLSVWAACLLVPTLAAQECAGFVLAAQTQRFPEWLLASGDPLRLCGAVTAVAIATGWILLHTRRLTALERPFLVSSAASGGVFVTFELGLFVVRGA